MAELVFVHGIAQENREPEEIYDEWVDALDHGFRELAFEVEVRGPKPAGITAAVAYYGDLYRQTGAMGHAGPTLSSAESDLAELLAREWMERVRDRGTHPSDTARAEAELAANDNPEGEAMGAGAVAGRLVTALSKIRWFTRGGFALAERLPRLSLWQVARYFTDDDLRSEAVGRVVALIDDNTKIVIGHSLGSVVAFEALHEYPGALPLFVTLGSPLGLRTIILERLRPQPPGIPSAVQWWVNIADRDDVVAANPDLEKIFRGEGPGAVLEAAYTVDNGTKPHYAGFYLRQPETCRPIGQTLHGIGPADKPT
jgi:hypothetical protein